jgi:iron complex outermembrane receptor protein
MYGVEFDGTVQFNDYVRVDGSVEYVNSKLVSISLPSSFPGYDIVFASALAGDPLPFTPKWGVNIGPTFTLPTPESLGRIEFGAVYRYNSSYATAASSASSFLATPISQLDLNLDWRNVGGRPVSVSLFATNVTNQFTRGIVVPLLSVLGYQPQYFGQPPRMYGVRVRAQFGP